MHYISFYLIMPISIIMKNRFKRLELSQVLRMLQNVVNNVLYRLVGQILANFPYVFFLCSKRLGNVPNLRENFLYVLLDSKIGIFHIDYKKVYSLLQISFRLL